MKIWIVRHGQTRLNAIMVLQGHTDEPLNAKGVAQAHQAREKIGDVHFDKVYASTLKRAIETGAIVGGVSESEIVTDPRIMEVNFGRKELKHYLKLGPKMILFWAFPRIFHAPKTVEPIHSLVSRTSSFLDDVLKEGRESGYENILVACHGGSMRALCGYMMGKKHGYVWRPGFHNCEVRVYDADPGQHRMVADYRI